MARLEAGEFRSIPEALVASAERNAGRSVVLLDNRGREASRRSFPELIDSFRAAASKLSAAGVGRGSGERIIVCLPTSWEWLEVWFGALFLGALPVSIAPPGALGSPAAQIRKALLVARNVDARLLIAGNTFVRDSQRLAEEIAGGDEDLRTENQSSGPRIVDVDTLPSTSELSAPFCASDPEEIAFLQLTSGSTGIPRAVEISHRAALHNVWAMRSGVEAPHDGAPTEQMVSWLPLYHDMGLVGCLMNSLLNGFDLDLLTPRSFLARPWVWLQALSRHRERTILSTAPNFAYQLCVERTPRKYLSSIDLGGWRDAMTGSEMVRKETADAFCDYFRESGFRPRQLRPCYGMAETTLAITFDSELEGARTHDVPGDPSELAAAVSCGRPIPDTEVRIVSAGDPAGTLLQAGTIGRVQVTTPSLFSGYYRDAAATEESFVGDGWFDTGDLGFLDARGELYLTGRSKDLLILHGQNVAPHELEWIAEDQAGGGGSTRSAAFSIPSEAGELPVLLLETSDDDEALLADSASAIKSAIGRATGVPLYEIVWVKRGSIPRTSSGKIMRQAARAQYLQDQLERRG